MNTEIIKQLKREAINELVKQEIREGRRSILLARKAWLPYSKCGLFFVSYYVNTCSQEELDELKNDGFTVTMIPAISDYAREILVEAAKPKGWFRKTVSQEAVKALELANQLPFVAQISWE